MSVPINRPCTISSILPPDIHVFLCNNPSYSQDTVISATKSSTKEMSDNTLLTNWFLTPDGQNPDTYVLKNLYKSMFLSYKNDRYLEMVSGPDVKWLVEKDTKQKGFFTIRPSGKTVPLYMGLNSKVATTDADDPTKTIATVELFAHGEDGDNPEQVVPISWRLEIVPTPGPMSAGTA